MTQVLSYKGYEGAVDFDAEAKVLRGKILFISDLVTFQSSDCAEIEKEFRAAVDDYIEFCAEVGREPAKPLNGQFNVRVTPRLHRLAASRSIKDGVSLNSVVVAALENYLNPEIGKHYERLAQAASAHIVQTVGHLISSSSRKSADDVFGTSSERGVLARLTVSEDVWHH